MPGSIAEAAVELVADGKKFSAQARATIKRGLAGTDKEVSKSTGKGMAKAGDKGGKDWSQAFRTAIATHLVGKLGSVMAPLKGLGAGIGLSYLSVQLAAAASAAVQLGAALAPTAGIVAALPGSVAVAGAAFSTLKVALSGVGDAFSSALTEADPKKFEESIAELSPAAQTVARDLHSVKPALDDLKSSVQDAFFQPLVGQLQQVGAALAGPLKAGMTGVSAEMGRAAAGLADFAKESKTVETVNAVFASTRTVLANIGPGLGEILRGFRDLISVALPGIESMSSSIGNLATQFGQWLQEAAASGKALDWINGAVVAFGQLWTVAQQLVGVIAAIGTAANAAGGNMLGGLGEGLRQINAYLSSAEGQTALVSLFQALNAAGAQFGGVLSALGSALTQLSPQAAAVATAIGPGIASAVSVLGSTLASLGPAVTAVAAGLSQAFASPAMTAGLQALAAGFSSLLTTMSGLAPALGPVAAVLGAVLGSALQTIGVLLQPIIAGFSALAGALSTLQGPLGLVGGALAGLATGILAVTAAAKIWTGVQWALNAALSANPISLIVIALAALVGAFIWAWNNIAGFREFWIGLWNGLVTIMQPVVTQIQAIWGALVAWWGAVWAQIQQPVMTAWAIIQAVIQQAFAVISAIFSGGAAAWIGVLVGAWNMIKGVVMGALSVIQGIIQVVTGLISGNWATVWAGIQNIVSGVWTAITGIISGAAAAITGLVIGFTGMITGVFSAAWNGLVNIVSIAWNAVTSAVTNGVNNVITTVQQLPARIQAFFNNAGTWLLDAGRNIINGLINGIKSMIGSVGDAIGGVAQTIRDYLPFSPAKEGPLSAGGAPEQSGRSIARQLAGGLASERGRVRAEMHRALNVAPPVVRHRVAAAPATAPGMTSGSQITRQQHRQVSISAPITVNTRAANPAIVARKTADRLAALAQG